MSYLNRLIERVSGPAIAPAPQAIFDPFEAVTELPAAIPPPGATGVTTSITSEPPQMRAPMRTVQVRSGELPPGPDIRRDVVPPSAPIGEIPLLSTEPKPLKPPYVEPPERRSEKLELDAEVQQAIHPQADDLQGIADRFMAEIAERSITSSFHRPDMPGQPLHAPPPPEPLRPREPAALSRTESPAEPAPAGAVIGSITVEVLPPSPKPEPPAPPRAGRTIVVSGSGSVRTGLRSPSRFGLGQL